MNRKYGRQYRDYELFVEPSQLRREGTFIGKKMVDGWIYEQYQGIGTEKKGGAW